MGGIFTKRQKKKLLQLLIALLITGCTFALNRLKPPAQVLGTVSPGYYQVVEFADGDTISVDMSGKTERIRLIGVDTPETHDPRKAVQCFGQAAADFTKKLIGDQPVRLAADELSTNRDRYNRLLRYAYLPNGQLVQEEVIKQGYGFAYTSFPFTKADKFKQLEAEAREQGRGLWKNCQPAQNENGNFTSNDQP